MQYLEAPNDAPARWPALFLAGGITNCPQWQREVVAGLSGLPLTIFNPRRTVSEGVSGAEQVTWEFNRLRQAQAILFWFPAGCLCPIGLYELGAWAMTEKPLLVGTDPRYLRRYDIVLQLGLARPDVAILDNLEALIEQARNFDYAAISRR